MGGWWGGGVGVIQGFSGMSIGEGVQSRGGGVRWGGGGGGGGAVRGTWLDGGGGVSGV